MTAQPDSPARWLEQLHLTASGTAARVENFSRTSYEPTRKDASTYEFALAGNVPRQLAPGLLLLASGEVTTLSVVNFSRADETAFAGRLELQRKFGLGPQAFVLSGSIGGRYQHPRLDDSRGWTTQAGLQLSKRLLPNLRAVARADWLDRDSAQRTFDTRQHSFSLEARWDLDEHWALDGSASRLTGDIVANAAWPVWQQAITGGFGPVVRNYYTSRPWWVTDLYGPGWVSYNVEADVDLWSAALSYTWSERTSLELRRGSAYVVNHIGIAYPTSSWSLSLTHRF